MRQADLKSLFVLVLLDDLPHLSSSRLISAHKIILPIDDMEVLFAYDALYKYESVSHYFDSFPYPASIYHRNMSLYSKVVV